MSKIVKNFSLGMLLTAGVIHSEADKQQVEPVSFVNRTHSKQRTGDKQEKNVTQKVIDSAKNLTDALADTVVSLVNVGKRITDVTFAKLEEGNKKELNQLYHRLEQCQNCLASCQEEVLEIQSKIDTLRK